MRRVLTVSLWALLLGTAGASAREGAPCGGIAELQCADGLFCDLRPGNCARVGVEGLNLSGTCVRVPAKGQCPKSKRPVCGCNGNTYPGDCERRQAGEAKHSDGACRN